MVKKRVKCPFCGKEMTLAGILGHVRFKEPDKLDEFREKYYPAMKGDAAKPKETPKETPTKPPAGDKPKEKTPVTKPEAGDAPKTKSFLGRVFDPDDEDW